MKKFAKYLSLLLAMLMAFSLMAACGGDEDKPADDQQGEEQQGEVKDSIVIATANEPPMVHPYDHNATAASYMNGLTFNTLFNTDVETLEPIPGLVKEYEILSDTEWLFTLHEGVKFHNGETLTSDDVIATFHWMREYTYTSMYSVFWKTIEKVDDLTFKVVTNTPYAKTLYDLTSYKIVPASLIESGHDFNKEPIGTGPYVFKEWDLGNSITFEAFEDYYEGTPAIKNMTWRIIPEGASRTIALEADEIDYIVEVETNDLARLKEMEGVTVVQKTGTQYNYMMVNNEVHPFDNEAFRKGCNSAIDKAAVAQVALSGAGTGVYGLTPSVFAGYSEENIQSYDPEAAQKYFDESGLDLSTVSFSCICSDDTKRRAAEVIQAALGEYGITMEIESMDLATYLSTTTDGNYQAALGNYTSSNLMSLIEGIYYSKSIGGSNRSRLNDAKVDELYISATQTLDDAERTALLEQCSARLNEVCTQIPTYQADMIRAYDSNLEGVAINASGGIYWQYVSWAE